MGRPSSRVRVQKLIRDAGLCSRREAERWIQSGRVKLNGKTITQLGTVADPKRDVIEVDGRPLTVRQMKAPDVYYMLHKPKKVVTTLADPRGRRTVADLIEVEHRVHPVGRLDYHSEGLLLLTNDGQLTYRLTHPSFEIEKVYRVCVEKSPDEGALRALRDGIKLSDGPTYPAKVTRRSRDEAGWWVEISIHEGRNRQVRRMFSAIGHDVLRLIRVQMGPVRLGNLPPGHHRPLSPEEVQRLKKAVRSHSTRGHHNFS